MPDPQRLSWDQQEKHHWVRKQWLEKNRWFLSQQVCCPRRPRQLLLSCPVTLWQPPMALEQRLLLLPLALWAGLLRPRQDHNQEVWKQRPSKNCCLLRQLPKLHPGDCLRMLQPLQTTVPRPLLLRVQAHPGHPRQIRDLLGQRVVQVPSFRRHHQASPRKEQRFHHHHLRRDDR